MKWLLRILSAFGGLIVFAFVVLFVLSRSSDIGKAHFAIEIQSSPERLYPWLHQGERARQWVSWLVETRRVGAQTEGVGTREIWVLKDPNMNDQLIPVEGICTEFQPPSRLAMRLSSAAFTGTQVYSLTALAPNRTRLEVDSNYTLPGWFPKLMQPLVMPAAKQKMNGDLARLKSLVERDT